MSLLVWLPLNGNIKNQGLTDITFTNNGATVDNNGKIGQCYNFNGTNYLYENTYNWTNFNNKEFSLCCWYKLPSPVASGNSQIICIGTSSGWNNIRIGLLRRTSNGYPMFSVSDGSSAVLYNCTATTFPLDVWNHIVCTYNNGEIKIYLNGILNKTYTTTIIPILNTSLHLGIAAASNGAEKLTGQLNDVRIYDHCLSDKEVQEIAKGLVLHYKLDDSYAEATTMLSCNITETAYNSPISKYGYNDESNLIKTIGNFLGKECVKIGTRVAGLLARPYTYFGNLYTSNGTNSPEYKALSFDYYTTVPTTTWLNIYKLGNGQGTATWKTTNSDGIQSGTYTNSANAIIVKPNEWNHVEVVFHGTTDADAQWGYCINGADHTTSADYYFLFANILLELNDHVTGYNNNFHSSIISDSSGYLNNGILNSQIQIDSNTAKYTKSTFFDGVNTSITIPYKQVNPDGVFTMNLWFYKDALGSENYETLFGGPSGFEMDTRAGGSTTLSLYMASTRGGNVFSPFNLNEWYMVTMVRDGTNEMYYINGELKKTIEAKSMPNGTYFIGAWSNASGQNYYGNISDFRLYTTCLTEDQILDLYHTSSTIDNKGNVYARELVEI